MPDSDDPLVGQTLLGKLRVIRRIGAGGMGVVYEVEHLMTRHRRALKVLRPELSSSAEAVARMVREAGVAGRLQSPFVAETYDVGRLPNGATYVLMELVEGRSFRALLEEHGRLPAGRAARLVADVCEGLEAVHGAGIVHRDLKPENLFVTAGEPRVRILDFGVMKLDDGVNDTFGALTRDGGLPCTPSYMAPEQAEGASALDVRADIYALGVTLYEALGGCLPFTAPTLAALAVRIHQGSYRPLADVAAGLDPALEAVVRRAMSRDREARYATVTELRAALLPFADAPTAPEAAPRVAPAGHVITELPASFDLARPATRARSKPPLLAVAIGVSVVALLVAWIGGVAPRPASSAAPRADPPSEAAPTASVSPLPSASASAVDQADATAVPVPALAPSSTSARAIPRPKPTARAPKPMAPSCSPPFTVGDDGIQRMRPECL